MRDRCCSISQYVPKRVTFGNTALNQIPFGRPCSLSTAWYGSSAESKVVVCLLGLVLVIPRVPLPHNTSPFLPPHPSSHSHHPFPTIPAPSVPQSLTPVGCTTQALLPSASSWVPSMENSAGCWKVKGEKVWSLSSPDPPLKCCLGCGQGCMLL